MGEVLSSSCSPWPAFEREREKKKREGGREGERERERGRARARVCECERPSKGQGQFVRSRMHTSVSMCLRVIATHVSVYLSVIKGSVM
jgi:hypothetical protein